MGQHKNLIWLRIGTTRCLRTLAQQPGSVNDVLQAAHFRHTAVHCLEGPKSDMVVNCQVA
jgi:hypothetical protein